jgi:8-oxo-dGTP diphosphatase
MKHIQKAIIKDGDKFLIILRSPDSKYFPNQWDFPGGKLEQNETPKEGVEREVKEETNLTIKAKEVLGIYKLDIDNIGQQNYIYTMYAATILKGELKVGPDHTKYKWATKEEILNLTIGPFLIEYFKEHP